MLLVYFVPTSEMRKQVRDASESLKGVGARILNPHIQEMVVATAPLDSCHLSVGQKFSSKRSSPR